MHFFLISPVLRYVAALAIYTNAGRTTLCTEKKWAPEDFAISWVKIHQIKYNFMEASDLEFQSLFF